MTRHHARRLARRDRPNRNDFATTVVPVEYAEADRVIAARTSTAGMLLR